MHDLDNILIELSFIFLQFLLFVANYQIMKKKIMHPAVLFSLIWFSILLLHFIFKLTLLSELFPLSVSTFLVFFFGTLAFSLGGFIQTVIWQKQNSQTILVDSKNNDINQLLRIVLLSIIVIGLPFYIRAAYRVFLASNIDNFFIGLRTELSYGDEDIGVVKYLTSFSFIVFAINLFAYFKHKNTINRILLTVSLLLAFTYALFVTGRTLIFLLLCIYVGISYVLNNGVSIKKIGLLTGFFILFFISIGIMYGKGGDTENSLKENIRPAAEMTAIYLVSPLNAFEWETHHQLQINYEGNNSLRFFMKIGEQLHVVPNLKVDELVQPFVFVPYLTNVYTVYSPYIKDFGKLYAWLMIALFGFLHTWLYNKAVSTKNIRYTLYYSFLLFPLLISFFMDFYLTITSLWLQIIFFTEIFLKINQLLVRRKRDNIIVISQ